MPRNTREWAHRKLDSASNNIDWAGKHLNEVSETYKNEHPEISDNINAVLEFLAMTLDTIQQLKRSF